MKEKERRQLLGDAVCGFVNAQTTDEAYLPILNGIQKIFDFSPGFVEEIKKVFPTMGNITSPPKTYDEEWNKIISQEDKVLSGLRKKLGAPFELSCDRHRQLIVISLPSSKLLDFHELPEWKQAVVHIASMGMGPTRFRLADFSPLKGYKVRHASAMEYDYEFDLQDHEDMQEAIVAMTSGQESVLDDIKNLELDLQKSWTRFHTVVLHKEIAIQQKAVGRMLDSLIYNKPIKKDLSLTDAEIGYDLLSRYLEIYNKMPRSIIVVDEQDILKERYPIRDEDYLSINLPLKWLDRITGDLAYCLIEFLMPERNRKYMGKCPYCHHFFIKEQANRVRCYSGGCEKTYQARKKRKQRDKDPVKYF